MYGAITGAAFRPPTTHPDGWCFIDGIWYKDGKSLSRHPSPVRKLVHVVNRDFFQLCILWSGVMDWNLGLEPWSGVLEWILTVEPWSEKLEHKGNIY